MIDRDFANSMDHSSSEGLSLRTSKKEEPGEDSVEAERMFQEQLVIDTKTTHDREESGKNRSSGINEDESAH